MNVKNNRRRQQSREKIEKAFIEMLQTKELSQISVSDICKKTELNRSTFYANYTDIYELADKIRDNLENEVEQLYENDANKYNSGDWLRLFYHIRDNQLFYKTYFKLGYDSQKINISQLSEACKIFPDEHMEYHVEFFKAGFNAIIKRWLERDCRESPEELGEILKSEYRGRLA